MLLHENKILLNEIASNGEIYNREQNKAKCAGARTYTFFAAIFLKFFKRKFTKGNFQKEIFQQIFVIRIFF